MSKMLFPVTVIILMLSCGTFAGIFSYQAFPPIDEDNVVQRSGGQQWAFEGNQKLFAEGKMKHDPVSGSTAIQGEGAVVRQASGAVGLGGFSGVYQDAEVGGHQVQIVGHPLNNTGPSTVTVQSQTLKVDAEQTAYKVGGIGGAGGSQGVLVGQKQTAVTPNGLSTQSQYVGIGQTATVAGGTGSIAVAHQSVDVKTHQFQLSN
jgi:hypothetical protein